MNLFLIALLFSVRPVDPLAADALDLALTRSSIVRALVAALDAAHVVVHIQSSRDLPPGLAGTTRFVVSRGGYRYLRITINAQLSRDQRMSILAHELQHAREIADSGAQDVQSVKRWFERAGRGDGRCFETRAAIDVERAVWMELRSTAPRRIPADRGLQPEPVIKFDH